MSQHHRVEVRTPALDLFLQQSIPQRLVGGELALVLEQAFDQRPDDPPPRPQRENHAHRVMVCWRIARAIAIVLGLCAEDESLDHATDADGQVVESPWHFPTRPRLSPSQQQLVRLGEATAVHRVAAQGVPLLPPTDRYIAPIWCEVARLFAEELRINRTPQGRLGLLGLLDPEGCPWAAVTETQVLALEDMLVDEAGRSILECGERPTVDHFRDKYGLARKEAVGLIRLARADAMRMGSSSVEEDRALMVAQLKDLVARAKEEMNTDKELRALKELARVQGLTRTDPEDLGRTFAAVIAGVAQRQDRKMIEAHAVVVERPQLTAAPAQSEYVLPDDEDAEALAEFERENG